MWMNLWFSSRSNNGSASAFLSTHPSAWSMAVRSVTVTVTGGRKVRTLGVMVVRFGVNTKALRCNFRLRLSLRN